MLIGQLGGIKIIAELVRLQEVLVISILIKGIKYFFFFFLSFVLDKFFLVALSLSY
jgi:hypothetical protein